MCLSAEIVSVIAHFIHWSNNEVVSGNGKKQAALVVVQRSTLEMSDEPSINKGGRDKEHTCKFLGR